MADDSTDSDKFGVLKRYIPLIAWGLVCFVLIAIPFKIISYGYLPQDDALRSSAHAVSGKPWQDILVLSHMYKIDHEFGWSWLLAKMHHLFGLNAEGLVIFSVAGLFLVVNGAALPWLRRPEAWLAALAAAMVSNGLLERFMIGRPLLVSEAGLIALLLLWQQHGSGPPKPWIIGFMIAVTAASTFFHGAWYLWVLLGAAFFLAGQFRWCFTFGVCWVIGVFIGAACTGHPIAFPLQQILLAFRAIGMHFTRLTVSNESQPLGGDIFSLTVLGGVMVLRHIAGLESISLAKSPAFWMFFICWVLAFKTGRFWFDWGMPAIAVLVAVFTQAAFEKHVPADSFRRLGWTFALALSCYMGITADVSGRWTTPMAIRYLTPDKPQVKGWLPAPGGILYSEDMSIFYETFFKNPHGDWRYMVGFEPTWMPKKDVEIYESIMWNMGDPKAYTPWIKMMTPADRLVIPGGRGAPPNIPQLDWNYAVSGIWVGRLPQPVEKGTAAPTIPASKPMSTLPAPETEAVPPSG